MRRKMKSASFALIFILVIFIVTMSSIEKITASNAFGCFGLSIAVGSIVYFSLFAPYGAQTHTSVFGRRQKHLRPVAIIPSKVVVLIFIPVILCLAFSFGFYTHVI
jgi:archaellum biogenesis protein FlaJ (TadC family)